MPMTPPPAIRPPDHDTARESLVPAMLRVSREGVLIGIEDHLGNNLGLPVTTQKSAQEVRFFIGTEEIFLNGSGPQASSISFLSLLRSNGFVNDPDRDNSAALQAAVVAARTFLNGACCIHSSISTIKLASGINLRSDTDRISGEGMVLIDASDVTTGPVFDIDGSISDGNIAALRGMMNQLSDLRIVGAGSPTVEGAVGVSAIRYRGTHGKSYFYQVSRVSIDGFETGVDLAGDSFGGSFNHCIIRSAKNGTCIKSLDGDGTNYGERNEFNSCMFYNSWRGLLNRNPNADYWFNSCSWDTNGVDIETYGGTTWVTGHMETRASTDYQIKIYGSITTVYVEAKINFIGYSRSIEFAYVDASVLLGGFFMTRSTIAHAGGYGCPTYVAGPGRAHCENLTRYATEKKVPFSAMMNQHRGDMNSVAAVAEYALGGTTIPLLTTTEHYSGTGSMHFPPDPSATTADLFIQVQPSRLVSVSYFYKKTGSTIGAGDMTVTGVWMDKNLTAIGPTLTLRTATGDTSSTLGDTENWTMDIVGTAVPPPPGAMWFRLRFQKGADAGNVAHLYIDSVVDNVI
jgi:hypothetical protein